MAKERFVNARMTISLAAVVAIAAIAVGCGGGDSGSATSAGITVTTSSLDKAAFLKKANAACSKEREKLIPAIEAYFKKYAAKLPENVLIASMAKAAMVPTVEAEIAAVRKLGAPAGDEDEIATILAAQQKAVDQVKTLKKAPSLEAVEGRFHRATKMYEAYGFASCMNSP